MLNGTEISSLYRQRIRNMENMLALISQHCAVHVSHYDIKKEKKIKKMKEKKNEYESEWRIF